MEEFKGEFMDGTDLKVDKAVGKPEFRFEITSEDPEPGEPEDEMLCVELVLNTGSRKVSLRVQRPDGVSEGRSYHPKKKR